MKMDYEMAKLSCKDILLPGTEDEPERGYSSRAGKKQRKKVTNRFKSTGEL